MGHSAVRLKTFFIFHSYDILSYSVALRDMFYYMVLYSLKWRGVSKILTIFHIFIFLNFIVCYCPSHYSTELCLPENTQVYWTSFVFELQNILFMVFVLYQTGGLLGSEIRRFHIYIQNAYSFDVLGTFQYLRWHDLSNSGHPNINRNLVYMVRTSTIYFLDLEILREFCFLENNLMILYNFGTIWSVL